jgi:hypothetical protein
MLIAQHAPIMKIYRLKGHRGGQNVAFSGNVINVVQDMQDLVTQLPRLPADLPIFKVRRKYGEAPDEFKDFKIRRERIVKWLAFLMKWNELYRETVTILPENIARLPEDGSVASELRDLLHDDNVPNDDVVANRRHDDSAEDDDIDSVDGGIEDGSMDVNTAEVDNILETGISGMLPTAHHDEVVAIRNAIAGVPQTAGNNQQYTLDWPRRGADPLDEYNTAHLLARFVTCTTLTRLSHTLLRRAT